MTKAYFWVATRVLESILKMPDGVHIEGVLVSELRPDLIGIIVSGDGLPTDGESMSAVVPIYESMEGDECRFVEWEGAPG